MPFVMEQVCDTGRWHISLVTLWQTTHEEVVNHLLTNGN